MHSPVKVRIFLLVLLLACAATTCAKPTENYDTICQREFGSNYVFDEGVQACVACSTCDRFHTDPHCMKCRKLGLIAFASTPSQRETTPTLAPGTTEQPWTTTSTKPSTLMSANILNGTSPGKTTGKPKYGLNGWMIVLIAAPCLLLLPLGLYVTKKRLKKTNNTNNGPIQQETGTPDEQHPMHIIPRADV